MSAMAPKINFQPTHPLLFHPQNFSKIAKSLQKVTQALVCGLALAQNDSKLLVSLQATMSCTFPEPHIHMYKILCQRYIAYRKKEVIP